MKKTQDGITLVALVITVIVLLILAGASVGIVVNSEDVFKRSVSAREQWNIAVEAENQAITEVYDVLDSISTAPAVYTVYTLGQEVVVGGENFFVIEENDTSSNSSITLISKYNLNKDSNNQATYDTTGSVTNVAFCSDPDRTYSGYWGSISGITYPYDLNNVVSERATSINKAKAYGQSKGGTGRLLTYEEFQNLNASNKIQDILLGRNYTTGQITENCLLYWIGSAYANYSAYYVTGTNCLGGNNCVYVYAGVRPVITVPKTLVSLPS